MRIDAALKSATALLNESSTSARLDAEMLLAHCLGKRRNYLYTWPEQSLSTQEVSTFNTLLSKRAEQYPIAYLTGYQEFWSLTLNVTPDVLIPRSDTELLVETALEKILTIKKPKILELGTGSGAIALALATERADSEITATDISDAALGVAAGNKRALNIENVQFIKSNWFSHVPTQTYDLIVSNPPYLDPLDTHLGDSIRHEPIQALVSEGNGLNDLKYIAQHASPYIKHRGWLILEHGYDQGEVVSTLLNTAAYQQVSCLKDLGGNDRINIGLNVNATSPNIL